MPERSLESQLAHQVELWAEWLVRWQPGTHKARVRVCRRCFGSPILRAAGLTDVPHGVQHAFTMRMKSVIDDEVDRYTAENLPTLHRELVETEARKARRSYRAAEGLDPEHLGLDLDPEADPVQPFLFTLDELDQAAAEESHEPEPRPFTEEEKRALRSEIALADEFAKQAGTRVCIELGWHRARITAALDQHVEPQIAAMLAELGASLDAPFQTPD